MARVMVKVNEPNSRIKNPNREREKKRKEKETHSTQRHSTTAQQKQAIEVYTVVPKCGGYP
jgi:hypothetical protein